VTIGLDPREEAEADELTREVVEAEDSNSQAVVAQCESTMPTRGSTRTLREA